MARRRAGGHGRARTAQRRGVDSAWGEAAAIRELVAYRDGRRAVKKFLTTSWPEKRGTERRRRCAPPAGRSAPPAGWWPDVESRPPATQLAEWSRAARVRRNATASACPWRSSPRVQDR